MNKSAIIILLFSFIFMSINAQDLDSLLQNKRVYTSVDIGDTKYPKIDGVLDDTIWDIGDWQGDFTQQQPYTGMKASENTYVKVLYDRSNLFVAIICADSDPGQIRDVFMARDQWGGDVCGIGLDSYLDRRTAFEFNLSAAGQKLDIKHLGDYQFNFNWNAVWDGASSKNDTGWVAEMRIPFSQIRYNKKEEHLWGMHVRRHIERKKEEAQWQLVPQEAPAMVYLFGNLDGIKNIRSSRQVELLPYTLGSLAKYDDDDRIGNSKINAGMDAKVGISSDYTLDLTINPDFGQVEADPSVLNLTALETFFEEKRPFFLEGNEIFDFQIGDDITYYSRRIGSSPSYPESYGPWDISDAPAHTTILGSAKLTGRSSRGLSVGLVNGLTAQEYGKARNEEGEEKQVQVSPLTNYLASRIKKESSGGNTIIGGVFNLVNRIGQDSVSRDYLPGQAVSGGFDFIEYWNNKNYFFETKFIASQMKGSADAILRKQLTHNHRFQRPGASHLGVDSLKKSLEGHGGSIRAGKSGGNFRFSFFGHYRSPGINLNDIGYMSQADYIGEHSSISYVMNDPGKWIRNYGIALKHGMYWSWGGELVMNDAEVDFSVTANNLWIYNLNAGVKFPQLSTRELRGGPAIMKDPQTQANIHIVSNQAKNLWFGFRASYEAFDMPGSRQQGIGTRINWRPFRKLMLEPSFSLKQRSYHQQYVATLVSNGGYEYLISNIDQNTSSFTFEGEFYFTPEISIQYYGSPYYSVGKYTEFRRVANAGSRDINQRLEHLDVSYDPDAGEYLFEYHSEILRFCNPDFSFIQFRSNLVFRWEYQLGSTLYLVWSHDSSGWESAYNPVNDIVSDIFSIKGSNVFMIKLNYWFSL